MTNWRNGNVLTSVIGPTNNVTLIERRNHTCSPRMFKTWNNATLIGRQQRQQVQSARRVLIYENVAGAQKTWKQRGANEMAPPRLILGRFNTYRDRY